MDFKVRSRPSSIVPLISLLIGDICSINEPDPGKNQVNSATQDVFGDILPKIELIAPLGKYICKDFQTYFTSFVFLNSNPYRQS